MLFVIRFLLSPFRTLTEPTLDATVIRHKDLISDEEAGGDSEAVD